eukprot:GILI01030968.1.p1 GENE.GILI01030968.1~~GILI01030968.1.p1  ORF type:complete len:175 (-),score=9.34 GILI01030968.1:22-501(-)
MRRNLLAPPGATPIGARIAVNEAAPTPAKDIATLFSSPTPDLQSSNLTQVMPMLRWRIHSSEQPWLLCFTQLTQPIQGLLDALAVNSISIITSSTSASQATRLADASEKFANGEHIVAVELGTLSQRPALPSGDPYLCAIFAESDTVADNYFDMVVRAN